MNSMTMPPHYIRDAVARTLRGSSLEPSRIEAIASLMTRGYGQPVNTQAKGLAVLLSGAFDWPWFDEWADRFEVEGKWPRDAFAWDWISAASRPVLATVADYLDSLNKPADRGAGGTTQD